MFCWVLWAPLAHYSKPRRGLWGPPIYSHLVRITGDNPNFPLATEVGSDVGGGGWWIVLYNWGLDCENSVNYLMAFEKTHIRQVFWLFFFPSVINCFRLLNIDISGNSGFSHFILLNLKMLYIHSHYLIILLIILFSSSLSFWCKPEI